MTRSTTLCFLAYAWSGCLPTVTPDGVNEDTSEPIVPAVSDTGTPQTAIVAGLSKDYSHGAISTVNLEDWSIEDSIVPTSGDVVVRASDETAFVLNRLNTDTVQVFSGALAVPDLDVGMPDLSNPQDAVICNDQYWVTLHNASFLPRFNDQGLQVGEVDLTEWVGSDGSAEAASMVRSPSKEHVYVTVQQFMQDEGWTSEGGAVLEISCADGSIQRVMEMGPSPSISPGPDEGLLGYKTGLYGVLDGEIGTIDRATEQRTVYVTDTEVGTDLGAYAFFGEHLVYAASDSDWVFKISCLNITTGETQHMDPLNQYVSDITADAEGRFWVSLRHGWADGSIDGVGVSVLDASQCASLLPSGQLLQFTLPPYNVAFR